MSEKSQENYYNSQPSVIDKTGHVESMNARISVKLVSHQNYNERAMDFIELCFLRVKFHEINQQSLPHIFRLLHENNDVFFSIENWRLNRWLAY